MKLLGTFQSVRKFSFGVFCHFSKLKKNLIEFRSEPNLHQKKNFELQNSSSKFLRENFFTLAFVQYNFEMAAMVEVIVVVLAVVWLGGSPGCRTNRELGFDASYCARDKNLPFATFRNNIFSFSNTVMGQK